MAGKDNVLLAQNDIDVKPLFHARRRRGFRYKWREARCDGVSKHQQRVPVNFFLRCPKIGNV